MTLTILLFELFGLVLLLSSLMFYAGMKYYKIKLYGYNFNNPLPIITNLNSKNQKKNESLKIVQLNSGKFETITKPGKIQKTKITKTTIEKINVTPRMTIYKTIDEE
ncbi:MAG: hypothetical protein N2321_02815 [Melioribacteraceae bacterium]|nr:hypothetical protein [Melioribacteraceae bacterium]